MDLKTWLRRQGEDRSPVGRLIVRAARSRDPELFFLEVAGGHVPEFNSQFRSHIRAILRQFRREGGRLVRLRGEADLTPRRKTGGVILPFETKVAGKPAADPMDTWRDIYADLLGIELPADPVVQPVTFEKKVTWLTNVRYERHQRSIGR